MKIVYAILFLLLIATAPSFADQDAADIISQMQSTLDLQSDQITNITPIIERYVVLFQDLQKSIGDNTINSSSADSQRQQLEDTETQELSKYLKPYQLSEWRNMQSKMQASGSDSDNNADQYSNLPNNPSQK